MIVELTAAAETDLEIIGDYIARDNPARAASVVGLALKPAFQFGTGFDGDPLMTDPSTRPEPAKATSSARSEPATFPWTSIGPLEVTSPSTIRSRAKTLRRTLARAGSGQRSRSPFGVFIFAPPRLKFMPSDWTKSETKEQRASP
jgi:hypothetical protein